MFKLAVINGSTFMRSLGKNKIDRVYLFFGEEFLIKEAFQSLKNTLFSGDEGTWDLEAHNAHDLTPEDLHVVLHEASIFASLRLVVIKGAEKYFSSGKNRSEASEKTLLEYLSSPFEGNCIAFIVDGKPDSRRKLYTEIKTVGTVVEFGPLKGPKMTQWINMRIENSDKKMDRRALEYFTAFVGGNLAVIDQELQKAALYAGQSKTITLEMVQDTLTRTAGINVFELVDSIGNKNPSRALELIREMLGSGESPVYLCFMVARQFRLMLYAKKLLIEGFTEKQVVSRLQLHPFVFKKLQQQAQNFSEKDLVTIMNELLNLDVSLKNSTKAPQILLEVFVLRLCSI